MLDGYEICNLMDVCLYVAHYNMNGISKNLMQTSSVVP
jgi:hypothetical protein